MALPNNNDKKTGLNETFLALVVIGVITLIAALYKFNAAKEWVDSKKSESIKVESVQREKFMDKYVDDYAEGAAWAMKNGIADPEECEDTGVSSLNNLGCVTVATELKDQIDRDVARGMTREDAEMALEPDELAPEEAFLNEAYLEPEIN